jgi:hypothetical protein
MKGINPDYSRAKDRGREEVGDVEKEWDYRVEEGCSGQRGGYGDVSRRAESGNQQPVQAS